MICLLTVSITTPLESILRICKRCTFNLTLCSTTSGKYRLEVESNTRLYNSQNLCNILFNNDFHDMKLFGLGVIKHFNLISPLIKLKLHLTSQNNIKTTLVTICLPLFDHLKKNLIDQINSD